MMGRKLLTLALYAGAWLAFLAAAYALRFASEWAPYAVLVVVLLLAAAAVVWERAK